MKLLFGLLAASVASLIIVVVMVFLRIRKHRQEKANAAHKMIEEIDTLPAGQEQGKRNA